MENVLEKFVVFEGLDGAGTTTQAKLLKNLLDEAGIPSLFTYEPTGNFIGERIRSVLRKEEETTPKALALLYAADREDHLFNPVYGIKRALDEGKTVISDRYFFSSFAYQGVDLDFGWVKSLNAFPYPEFLIYIDTPTDECMKRISGRGNPNELFERRDFLEKVRANYERAFSDLPEKVKFLRIDGTLSPAEISKKIKEFLNIGK